VSATPRWTLIGMSSNANGWSAAGVDELSGPRADRRIGGGLLTIADGDLFTRTRPRRETSSSTIPTLRILGVPISTLTGDEALEAIAAWAERGTCQTLAYVNAHTLNLAVRVEALHRSLRRSRLVMNDGVGLNLAARMHGERFPENLNGSDFTVRLLQLAAARDWDVYFLGGEPGVAELAAERLEQRIQGLRVVDVCHGFTDESDEMLARRVRDSGATLLVVALGNPLQEIWLDRNLEATGALVGIGVGAFLDFTAGRVRRAPRWMSTLGIEWCFRLLQEPRRLWRRYILGNPLFLVRAWRDALQ
jgi:exopolysaccharide biosynthesis WecB/TagA/CpsF family protein